MGNDSLWLWTLFNQPWALYQTSMHVNRMWPKGQPGASQTHLSRVIRQNSEHEGFNTTLSTGKFKYWELPPSKPSVILWMCVKMRETKLWMRTITVMIKHLTQNPTVVRKSLLWVILQGDTVQYCR